MQYFSLVTLIALSFLSLPCLPMEAPTKRISAPNYLDDIVDIPTFLTRTHPISSDKPKIHKEGIVASSPFGIIDLALKAEQLAKALESDRAASNIIDIIKRAIEDVRNMGKYPDPYVFFVMLKAIADQQDMDGDFGSHTENAFFLMARSVLDAPFYGLDDELPIYGNLLPQDNKPYSGSFFFFRKLYEFKDGAIWKTEEIENTKAFLIDENGFKIPLLRSHVYFNEDGYPYHVVTWLDALLYFYQKEGIALDNFSRSGSKENLIGWLNQRLQMIGTMDAMEEYQGSLDVQQDKYACSRWYLKNNNKYFIGDPNIYWSLLPELQNSDEKTQEQFWDLMVGADADPLTIVDAYLKTPEELATEHGLSFIVKKIAEVKKASPPFLANVAKSQKAREYFKELADKQEKVITFAQRSQNSGQIPPENTNKPPHREPAPQYMLLAGGNIKISIVPGRCSFVTKRSYADMSRENTDPNPGNKRPQKKQKFEANGY